MEKTYDNVLMNYYNNLLHLRGAMRFVRDIEILNNCIENFEAYYAINVLKKYVSKYSKELNTIGKHFTGIMVFKNTQLYKQKTEDDLMMDLLYLVRCIVIAGAVKMGLAKTYYDVIKQINSENLNLLSFNIYE